jgi:hypothetical protein
MVGEQGQQQQWRQQWHQGLLLPPVWIPRARGGVNLASPPHPPLQLLLAGGPVVEPVVGPVEGVAVGHLGWVWGGLASHSQRVWAPLVVAAAAVVVLVGRVGWV